MKLFLLIFCLLGFFFPYSGNAQTPSLKTSLNADCNPSQSRYIIKLVAKLRKERKRDSVIQVLEKALPCLIDDTLAYAAYRYLGESYMYVHQYPSAMAAWEKAEEIYPQLPPHKQKHLYNLHESKGMIFQRWGDFDQAINSFETALLHTKRTSRIVRALISLGLTYRHKFEYATSRTYYEQALDKIGDNDDLRAFILSGFAELSVEQANYSEAIKHFTNAKRLFAAKLSYKAIVPEIEGSIAQVYSLMGQVQRAQRSFTNAIREGHILLDSTRELGKIYLSQAGFYAKLGQSEAALQSYQAALAQVLPYIDQTDPHSFSVPDSFPAENVIMDALEGKAKVLRSLAGQSKDSIKYHQLALQHWQWALQSQASLTANYQEHTSKYQLVNETRALAEPAIDQIWWLWQQTHDPKYLSLGFQLSERNKASMMLELMRELDLRDFQVLPLGERQHWDSLEQELVLIERELNVRQAEEDQKRLKNKRFSLKQSILQVEKRWERQYPAYQSAKNDLSTRSLQEIQKLLPQGKALLNYSIGDQQSYAWLIHPDTIIWTTLALDTTLNVDIRRFREALELGRLSLDDQAHQLYQKLLGPFEGQLSEINSLLIIPDQGMALLPFEALLTAAPTAKQKSFEKAYLLRKFAISYAFSATLWAEMSLPKTTAINPNILAVAPDFPYSEAVLAMAQEPDYNPTRSCLDPIQNMDEINSLAELSDIIRLVGKQATRKQLLKQLEEYAFVHIATHAMADDEDPRKTFLVLREEGSELNLCGENYPDMTALYMDELLHHRIAAEMVVLAACQTGIGKYHHGEGLSSLARSFALAGANSVVASLWSVDDRSTRMMMPRFYHYLQEGDPKDLALQKAKIDVLEGGMGAPVYWSSFIVMGDTQAIEIPEREANKWWWALLLLLPLVIMGVRRSRKNER
ncbi:MAG: CHAT domain-containing protein [Bacteroidia bacterium]